MDGLTNVPFDIGVYKGYHRFIPDRTYFALKFPVETNWSRTTGDIKPPWKWIQIWQRIRISVCTQGHQAFGQAHLELAPDILLEEDH